MTFAMTPYQLQPRVLRTLARRYVTFVHVRNSRLPLARRFEEQMGSHDYTLVAISSTAMSLRFTHSSAPDLEMRWQVDSEESAPCARQPHTCKG
jgi:hypothetical protein